MAGAQPRPEKGLLLVVDADQSASEQYIVSAWVFVMTTLYLTAGLEQFLPRIIAAMIAMPLGIILLHFVFGSSSALFLLLRRTGVTKSRHGSRFNALTMMAVLLAVTVLIARTGSWCRVIAWTFLAIVAANCVAAVIMLFLRGRVREMERRCGL